MTKPMLAVAADFDKIKYPVYASPKLDGIRCLIIDGVAKTRTLKDVPSAHVANILSKPELDGLDGELIVGRPTAKDVYNQTVSHVMAHDKVFDFTFFVFDMHNVVGGYQTRLLRLYDRFEAWEKDGTKPPSLRCLSTKLINDEIELLAYEAKCVEEGYEGIIVRANLNAPYKYGRSTVNEGSLLKVKRFEDSEAVIIGFEEEMFNGNDAQTNELGRTKRSTAKAGLSGKQTLGAFQVRDRVSGVEFSIGTGLTALQRGVFWQRRDDYLGKLVKYKYFPVGVKVAPRHPVFLGLRDERDL